MHTCQNVPAAPVQIEGTSPAYYLQIHIYYKSNRLGTADIAPACAGSHQSLNQSTHTWQ